MNYRHAYHAGNHADVFKHAVLVMLLEHLRAKPKAFTVLDTHAGAGNYDLRSVEAGKTGEAADGIGRIFDAALPAVPAYLDLIRHLNPEGLAVYPGSPAIIRTFLRDEDRLIVCELHEEEAAKLRRAFRGDRQVGVHHRDGYEAINAFVPLPSRRGLVFIDPPYEEAGEQGFHILVDHLNAGLEKWPGGMFAAWYPLKDRVGINALRKRYGRANPPTLAVEFVRTPFDGKSLAGSGLLIANPPFGIAERLTALGEDLAAAFAMKKGGLGLEWWIAER
ncbi:MAG: 23S rRNA (adenine(2030)-N(6))-methyltransferase RlmJ [Bauldia sp.]|nr:23S rRNA (adenine(2030)-N(6))-methyltransferase RlmJ [Bauldia sp.]